MIEGDHSSTNGRKRAFSFLEGVKMKEMTTAKEKRRRMPSMMTMGKAGVVVPKRRIE